MEHLKCSKGSRSNKLLLQTLGFGIFHRQTSQVSCLDFRCGVLHAKH